MIKKHHYIIFTCVLIIGTLFLLKGRLSKIVTIPESSSIPGRTEPTVDVDNLEIAGKKVIGLNPGTEKEDIRKIKVANHVSKDWEPNLKKTLLAQGGDAVKDLKIQKMDSFVWAQDGIALFVESVIVTIKNNKNAETTFRVLVDAQNGKILRNWDQPVIDPANPKDNFKIRIDPRYHNE